jgi:hypothetical protein
MIKHVHVKEKKSKKKITGPDDQQVKMYDIAIDQDKGGLIPTLSDEDVDAAKPKPESDSLFKDSTAGEYAIDIQKINLQS